MISTLNNPSHLPLSSMNGIPTVHLEQRDLLFPEAVKSFKNYFVKANSNTF